MRKKFSPSKIGLKQLNNNKKKRQNSVTISLECLFCRIVVQNMLLFCVSLSMSMRVPNLKFKAFGACIKATQISISNFAYLKLAASIVNILLHKDWPQTAIHKHADTAVLPLPINCFVLHLKDIKNHFKTKKN